MESIKFKTIDEYHATVPDNVKKLLEVVRKTIKKAAPAAKEVISYNMPAFRQNGVLVYYAANKAHIGLYPTSSPMKVFEKELKGFKTSKGAIQLPLDEPLPLELITQIVQYRVEEDAQKAARKK